MSKCEFCSKVILGNRLCQCKESSVMVPKDGRVHKGYEDNENLETAFKESKEYRRSFIKFKDRLATNAKNYRHLADLLK